ncbi:uncharacterized protein LOC112500397 [Cynara cardunculus var. scolymus]|uniref:uncharacterized protein LOC112500397 n=1 Tax=Cynara cardunculus var. scolymus TaxID=59895 RepID=UPI000D6271D3|nr:uncharacterized protein LOC112500397 [Cynara cardunculus var. scolymus]
MFEFGDELIIDSYRIPWLIWIQLLVMFLLVILLYYFSTTPSDLSLHFSTATATATASPSATGLSYHRSLLTSTAANNQHNSKDREKEIKETGTSTSEVVQRTNKPDGRHREGSSTTVEGDGLMFELPHHPCNFFGVAKQAFLKCLGFDSSPENPTRRRHEKND